MTLINRLTSGLLITLLLLIGGLFYFLFSGLTSVPTSFRFNNQDQYGPQKGSLASNTGRKLSQIPTLSQSAITTSSGLQYEDILVGEGKEAKRGDWLFVHYTGFLSDGTPFDSSIPSHKPRLFSLGTAPMLGWDEGLAGMREGGHRALVIPPQLAFGEQGWGYVPPHSTLVYDVQLLTIQTAPEPAKVSQYSTLESGLQSAILQPGHGKPVQDGDLVEFEFHAWVEDGILFNSSTLDGFPSILPVGKSGLAGLDQGLLGMKIRETRQIRIPPALAFAQNGVEGIIAPHATLIFEVTLLSVKQKPVMKQLDQASYTTTNSGLQIATLQKGHGASAKLGDQVLVHYNAWYADGTFLDSSRLTDIPHLFILGHRMVIPGWDEGISGMKMGEKRQLRIPPSLSTGAPPVPPALKPTAPLIFEIELLELQTSDVLAANQE